MVDLQPWLKAHKLPIGLAADILTFGGGLLLARDAFRHLVDLRAEQIEAAFRKRFSRLATRLTDTKEVEAREATGIAYRGLILLVAGFLFQLLSRFTD